MHVLHEGYARESGGQERVASTVTLDGPADDPLATDPASLSASRGRILDVATVIIPGHGPAFRPDPGTPR